MKITQCKTTGISALQNENQSVLAITTQTGNFMNGQKNKRQLCPAGLSSQFALVKIVI